MEDRWEDGLIQSHSKQTPMVWPSSHKKQALGCARQLSRRNPPKTWTCMTLSPVHKSWLLIKYVTSMFAKTHLAPNRSLGSLQRAPTNYCLAEDGQPPHSERSRPSSAGCAGRQQTGGRVKAPPAGTQAVARGGRNGRFPVRFRPRCGGVVKQWARTAPTASCV